MKVKKHVHTVVIPDDLDMEYKKIAQQRGMSRSQCVRYALRQALGEDINMPALVTCVVTLQEIARKNKGNIPANEHDDMVESLENIVKLLKGGHDDTTKHNQKPRNDRRSRKGDK